MEIQKLHVTREKFYKPVPAVPVNHLPSLPFDLKSSEQILAEPLPELEIHYKPDPSHVSNLHEEFSI
jgi:hypothetical protein